MTVMVEADLPRLLTLISELSNQLTQNKETILSLQRQSQSIKSQAIHTTTGFALKRFNVDLTKEEFESEIERSNAALTVENQGLWNENKNLAGLLKDYEVTLESVMGKFRAYAHATQQHELALHRHYESIILSLSQSLPSSQSPNSQPSQPYALPAPPVHPFPLSSSSPESYISSLVPPLEPEHGQIQIDQNSLNRIGSLVRYALRSINGEDESEEEEEEMSLLGFSGEDGLAVEELVSEFGSEPKDISDHNSSVSENEESQNNMNTQRKISLPPHLLKDPSLSSWGKEPSPSNRKNTVVRRPSLSSLSSTSSIKPRSKHHDPSSGGYVSTPSIFPPLPVQNPSVLVAQPPPPSPSSATSANSIAAQPPKPHFGKFRDPSLEERTELERLREENEALRRLLGISGIDGEVDEGEGRSEEANRLREQAMRGLEGEDQTRESWDKVGEGWGKRTNENQQKPLQAQINHSFRDSEDTAVFKDEKDDNEKDGDFEPVDLEGVDEADSSLSSSHRGPSNMPSSSFEDEKEEEMREVSTSTEDEDEDVELEDAIDESEQWKRDEDAHLDGDEVESGSER